MSYTSAQNYSFVNISKTSTSPRFRHRMINVIRFSILKFIHTKYSGFFFVTQLPRHIVMNLCSSLLVIIDYICTFLLRKRKENKRIEKKVIRAICVWKISNSLYRFFLCRNNIYNLNNFINVCV